MPEEKALKTKRIEIAAAFGMQKSKVTKRRAEITEIRLSDMRLPRHSLVRIIRGITMQRKRPHHRYHNFSKIKMCTFLKGIPPPPNDTRNSDFKINSILYREVVDSNSETALIILWL